DSAPVTEESYNALTLQGATTLKGAEQASAVKAVLPSLLDLLQFRVSEYAKAPPPSPLSERDVALFVTTHWDDLTAAQRTRAVQAMIEVACSGMQIIGNP